MITLNVPRTVFQESLSPIPVKTIVVSRPSALVHLLEKFQKKVLPHPPQF